MREITIYTDGACAGNPGKGGYGIVLEYKEHRKEVAGGYRLTTNNRMELMAVIKSLQSLKEICKVTLYTDSRYVVDSIEKGWAKKWRKNNWKKSDGKRALNEDLFDDLLQLLDQHSVKFIWVKGHANNEGNERCDHLATEYIKTGDLEVDSFYESTVTK